MIDQHYQLIAAHYGSEVAARSQVPLLNHIDEGITLLKLMDASDYTISAFCVHPLMQNDQDLVRFNASADVTKIDPRVMMYAMEYRKSANAYLSRPQTDHFSVDDIPTVFLEEVRQMLVADKIQNRKDFERHHLGTHARSDQLDRYFKLWLEKLGVSENRYQEWAALIS